MTSPLGIGFQLGIDIGGTFTDCVLIDPSRALAWSTKVLTSKSPEVAALEGAKRVLEQGGISFSDVSTVVHGTTLASNTVVQRRGATVGFITTAGFEDTLAIGREARHESYDMNVPLAEPLVPRSRCRGVPERVLVDGTEFTALDVERLRRLVWDLRSAHAVDALAICFLHSFRNPDHELEAREVVRDELGPEFPVSVSSEVCPEIREYERATTTALNAYLQPVVSKYLRTLESALGDLGYCGRLYVMLSAGGVTTAGTAAQFPARLLESGPAAGALAAGYVANVMGGTTTVAMDVGGTTAKACVVESGRPARATSFEVARADRNRKGSGLVVQLPSVDLIEIGAGGGSIGWVDVLGSLRLGPQSAESSPGPACYGIGGTEATVTDANLALGYVDPEFFAGGRIKLDKCEAVKALGRLGGKLQLTADDCAVAIRTLADEAMADAVRVHLAEHGLSGDRVVLLASGGGGPLHSVSVAHKLGIAKVIVPQNTGVLSAIGLLVTPISFELARSDPRRVSPNSDWEQIESEVAALETTGRNLVLASGAAENKVTTERAADLRWMGQTHSLTVSLPPGPYDKSSYCEIERAMDETSARLYGVALEHTRLELLTWRVTVSGPGHLSTIPTSAAALPEPPAGTRSAFFPGYGWLDSPILGRDSLPAGFQGVGPAIIQEWDSACVIHPGDSFFIDDYLNIIVFIQGAQ